MEGSGPFDFEGAHRRAQAPPAPPRRRGAVRAARSEQPGAPAAGRGTRSARAETLARIAWALPWIAAVVAVIVLGGPLFAAAMIAFACIALTELFRMARDADPFIPVAFAVTSGLCAAALYGGHFQVVIVLLATFPLMFVAAVLRPGRAGVTTSAALTVLGVVWIALPFAHAVLLRELPEHGAGLLVDVLVATFVADTAAYAGGRMFGRRRLAPALSPNKTVEGLLFGLLGGTLGFWFAGLYQDWLTGVDALVLGACVALVAPIGDLFESMVKRDLDVKDTGSAFGPHGGMLDRVDAVLFTVPAAYYLSVAIVV